jgi:hypothetical protein
MGSWTVVESRSTRLAPSCCRRGIGLTVGTAGRLPEPALRFVGVVRPADQSNVLQAPLPAVRHRDGVVKFEPARLPAPHARAGECAAPFIARPDGALHGGRDRPRMRFWAEGGTAALPASCTGDVDVAVVAGGPGGAMFFRLAANFVRSNCSTSSTSARSTIAAGSPLGTEWRSRSCARRRRAWPSADSVTRRRNAQVKGRRPWKVVAPMEVRTARPHPKPGPFRSTARLAASPAHHRLQFRPHLPLPHSDPCSRQSPGSEPSSAAFSPWRARQASARCF